MAFNFLDEVNNRLTQPRQRKSRLAAYFEAHYEFQEAYKSPSPSRSPTPELANLVPSPWPVHVSRKRSWSSVDDGSDSSTASVPAKRARTSCHSSQRSLITTRSRAGNNKIHAATFDDYFSFSNMGGLYLGQQAFRPRSPNSSVRRYSGLLIKPVHESHKFNSKGNRAIKSSKKQMLAKVQNRVSSLKAVRQSGRYVLRHTPARVKKAVRGAVHAT